MLFALEWREGERAQLCEVEGNVCYVWYTTAACAETEAAALNAEAVQQGWASRYRVVQLPEHMGVGGASGEEHNARELQRGEDW